eukprot:7988112-Karenia_brevis.AAC.1
MGVSDSKRFFKTLPPKCSPGRWGSIDGCELRLDTVGRHMVRLVLLPVLRNDQSKQPDLLALTANGEGAREHDEIDELAVEENVAF